MFDYVYTDHAQYTIKTYAKMALFPLLLTGPLSTLVARQNRSQISARSQLPHLEFRILSILASELRKDGLLDAK